MALTRQKKEETVTQLSDLLANSKLTVFAKYQGTPVKAMQQLRSDSSGSGTTVKVAKNRLFKKALESHGHLKDIDTGALSGQLLYAFNDTDEVAPAQNIAAFAKEQPQVEFVGAITAEGELMSADDVQALASLPTKEQLRGQLAGLVASPLSGMANVIQANLRSVMNVLDARAQSIS